MRLDHLAVSAATLAEGTAHVEAALGIVLEPGGRHDRMGTHNRLLGLGDIYLEVIATDPDAPEPAWPRWFDLDNFAEGKDAALEAMRELLSNGLIEKSVHDLKRATALRHPPTAPESTSATKRRIRSMSSTRRR